MEAIFGQVGTVGERSEKEKHDEACKHKTAHNLGAVFLLVYQIHQSQDRYDETRKIVIQKHRSGNTDKRQYIEEVGAGEENEDLFADGDARHDHVDDAEC